ncbi:MAG TPA: hypothetical protein VD906_14250 [Caulobacteraceae bacterium]|nr:hypothetical protein [Caulobacteraceae bacterium]
MDAGVLLHVGAGGLAIIGYAALALCKGARGHRLAGRVFSRPRRRPAVA